MKIYTDGSCLNNGQPNAKASWAFVVLSDDKEVAHESGLVTGDQTNNTGELTAILQAMLFAIMKCEEHVIIYSDSKYSINSISVWDIEKKVKGQKKKNYELIVEIQKLFHLSECDFELVWVRGHSDDHFNDKADRYAYDALFE